MSTVATANAVGIKFVADIKDAGQAIDRLDKQIGGFGRGQRDADFGKMGVFGRAGVDGLEALAGGAGRATLKVATLGTGLAALTVGGVIAGLLSMATGLVTAGAVAGRTADQLGLPVERLAEFRLAARLAGSSADAMSGSLAGLQATVADAAYGRDNEAWSVFHLAGIDVGNARDGARDYAAILPKIADETQRLARVDRNAALRFLDKVGVGRDLFPLLRNGSAGLQSYMAQARQFGPMTQKQPRRGGRWSWC